MKQILLIDSYDIPYRNPEYFYYIITDDNDYESILKTLDVAIKEWNEGSIDISMIEYLNIKLKKQNVNYLILNFKDTYDKVVYY